NGKVECVVCGDIRHSRKLYFCKQFRSLELVDKKAAVGTLGACKRCLDVHDSGAFCKHNYLCRNHVCKDENVPEHRYFLCSNTVKGESSGTQRKGKLCHDGDSGSRHCTQDQEDFLSKLPADLAQQCRNVFSNTVAKVFKVTREQPNLLAESGLPELPVIMMLLNVTANAGQKLASSITIGFSGIAINYHTALVETKRYLLKIRVSTHQGSFKSHQLACYGLESIAEVHKTVPAERLKKFFPDIPLNELAKPIVVDLLIMGDLVLWDGPLGKMVGGTNPELFEEVAEQAYRSKTHFARSMRIATEKYEEVTKFFTRINQWPRFPGMVEVGFYRAACEPKCGGCRCGNCQPGGKEMTLAEERELEIIRSGLTYVLKVFGIQTKFLRMEKQLAKEPEWKVAYRAQVQDMLDREAAVKLSRDTTASWNSPVWYISHLISPNPHSVTTPVRLVWNSSQRFRGVSMNDLLVKGPDFLNQIRAVLLRFRSGIYAALGDIRKMYNSEEELGEYAITRVNIGDKPDVMQGVIAQFAMHETANLASFVHLVEERRVLQQDSYVDNILTSHNDLQKLKAIMTNVELILKEGGFLLKPWVLSGQSGRNISEDKPVRIEEKIMVLPNQMEECDNKALGLYAIQFSKRKRKMRLGQNLSQEKISAQTPIPLTRKELLSQVSGVYDPVGIVTPAKQKRAILVQRAFQEAKKGRVPVNETWDTALSDDLREEAIRLFEEYVQLGKVTFTRALTRQNSNKEPCAITFSDGSENACGAVMYLRWNLGQGAVIRLVESKAKLTPLDHKGELCYAEMCGAVFASRLRKYFEQHSQIRVERWYHLRESYGYKTFFANRIGEIQGITTPQEWWWILGPQNIADNSEWQNRPKFLSSPVEEWPIKSARDLATAAQETINRLQKKAFAVALARSKAEQQESSRLKHKEDFVEVYKEFRRPPAGSVMGNLCEVERFSDLTRLVKMVAWVWRAAKRFFGKARTLNDPKWEAVLLTGNISVGERKDALRDIFLATQEGMTLSSTTRDRLVVYKDPGSGLLVCGGRAQVFREDQTSIPILPYNCCLSTLLATESHRETHGGLAETLFRIRKKAWVIKGRRIAQKVVDGYVQYKKATAKECQQIMGDLPPERTQPALHFEFTAVDLFGPYYVKDDVKKRTSMKVVFCCMSSRAIHAELANTQSTESLLMAFQRFAAIRGYPRKIYSDPGTNFIGARPGLQELYKFLDDFDKFALEERAAQNGTEWMWKIHPADSLHRNGAVEAALRVIKRALQNCGGGFFHFHMAANLTNECPIDARAQVQEDRIQYVTPNSLLLGRASLSGDIKTFELCTYPFKRLQAGQMAYHAYECCSWGYYLDYQNALRGQFKLGKVISVNQDRKGVVRDVNDQTSPSYSVHIKPSRTQRSHSAFKEYKEKILSTVLHGDVRRLVVLLPVEEKMSM
ncbi:gag-pol fusion polyprotein, partial [Triplophysa rosa]